MPARRVWSSSASPTARPGSSASRAAASAAMPASHAGSSRSGPRWPTALSSSSVRSSSTRPSEEPAACHSEFASTSRTRWSRGGGPARPIRQRPSISRCVWTVSPPSTRTRRCLPRDTAPRTVRPRRSAVANRGTRKSERVSRRPASTSCRRRAVSQTTSPSGIGLYQRGAFPGRRVLGELADRFGQLARRYVREPDLLEDRAFAGAQRDPHLLQGTRGALVPDVLGALAPDAEQGPVDGADDVGEGDLLGLPRQPVAALGAPLAPDESGPAQLAEDVLQEFGRYLLRLGQLDGGHRAAPGDRQFGCGAQRVVNPGGQSHTGIIPCRSDHSGWAAVPRARRPRPRSRG